VSLEDLERALERQLIHGGDAATNLLALGCLKEHAVLRLLADHHEMPAGPKGRLAAPPPEVTALVPPAMARRLGVVPFKRTSRTLHVAAPGPLAPDVELELRNRAGLQLRVAIVPAVRVDEALSDGGELPLPVGVAEVLARLDESPAPTAGASRGGVAYRRMSEVPEGVRTSRQQPGGPPPLPPSQPVPSDAPTPDSQGLWLDAFVLERGRAVPSMVPPSRPSVLPFDSDFPTSGASSAMLDASPSSLQRGAFAMAPTLPPENAARGPDTDELRIEFAPAESGGAVPTALPSTALPSTALPSTALPSTALPRTVPAPGAPLFGDRSRADRHVSSVDAATRIERTFRHRGPLSAAEATAFARAADEVELVLQIVARFARQYFERLLVFAVEGETAEARLAYGTGPRTPLLLVDLSGDGLLARAARTGAPFVGELTSDSADGTVRTSLGGLDAGGPVAVLPMSLRGRVIVLLYADDLGMPIDRDGLTAVEELCELAAEEMARIVVSEA